MDTNLHNKNILFIGIGGISMSGLARICKHLGANIFGTDITANENVLSLKKDCIAKIKIGNSPSFVNIADIIIYTNAIKQNNLDLKLAKRLNKPIYERATFLGIISCKYKNTIAVSGTHGKTTTTSLLGWIFDIANKPYTVHIGGISNNLGSNIKINGFKYFITEACEYQKSFLHLNPNTTIINNIEFDHPDCFKNIDDITKTFIQLSNQTKDLLIINGDSLNISTFQHKNTITFGLKNTNTIYAKNIITKNSKTYFDVVFKNKILGQLCTNLIGNHNIYNVLAATLLALSYSISFADIQQATLTFNGTKRRLECLNHSPNVFLDYAHHPSEIKATISSLMQYYGKITVVFQPHTYSRTLALINEFSSCFLGVSVLYILPTYPAREKEIIGGRAIDLFYNIQSIDAQYISNPQSLIYLLNNNIKPNDTVLFLGAGDIDIIAKTYVKTIIKSK